MRAAATGPVLTLMLAAGMPAYAALTLMPCSGCQLPTLPPRLADSRKAWKALITPPRSQPSYDDLFHAGHAAARGLTDRWAAHVFVPGASRFSIETVRRFARRSAGPEAIGMRRDTLSTGSATLRYALPLGPADSVSLGLMAGMEKQRFAFDLSRGHHVRSQMLGFVANWSHGTPWGLETGYRFDFGSRTTSSLERGIELAEGSQRSQRGAWTALSYTIERADAPTSLSFGVRAQAFRLTDDDRLAFGAAGRADNRLVFTTSFRFR
ncbi:hypothetical protein EIK56_13665 [Sphingomonas sp. C8-2]|jgi:hypothetical protein|nr:hypothetical protein EIK56_13665 [Sphingomonas sp. C8-2]